MRYPIAPRTRALERWTLDACAHYRRKIRFDNIESLQFLGVERALTRQRLFPLDVSNSNVKVSALGVRSMGKGALLLLGNDAEPFGVCY
jgi:hypothetical protein